MTISNWLRCIATIATVMAVSVTPSIAQGPGWTLVVTANGGVNVRLSPEIYGCTSQIGYGPYFASIYPTHPGIDRMTADLLAAYVSGATVALYLTDSTCTVGEMVLGGW